MATRAGVIMGTAAYMSPEQASGKPADKRADIWSFGVVLWELLTGHRLFEGETISHTLADVLRGPIDFEKLPRDTPPAIRNLLRRCLDRNVKNRLRDIGEARVALEAAPTDQTTPSIETPKDRNWIPWIAAAVVTVALVSLAFVHFRGKPPAPAAPLRLQLEIPGANPSGWSFLSPDGRKLVVPEGRRLKVHFLDSGETRDLADSNGTPIWSPDSRFLVYPGGNQLRKIAVTGGPSQTVADFSGFWGAGDWSKDDVIVFGAGAAMFRVPAAGGVPVQITAADPARQETAHYRPCFLPDGRHFVYIRASTNREKSAIYLGDVNAKPEQQSSKPLVLSSWGPWYAPSVDPNSGFLLFVREGTLMAQPFDSQRLELTGEATAIAEQVEHNDSSGYGSYSASNNDVLVFRQMSASAGQLTWYDREGKVLGTVGDPGTYQDLALSPDGKRLAWSKFGGKGTNIWLLDLASGASTRFTFGATKDSSPLWSPDGSSIIYTSYNDLYQKDASGLKEAEILVKSNEDKHATSWSRDGRFLLYDADHRGWLLPLKGDRKPIPLVTEAAHVGDGQFSPDGRWIAYISSEDGALPQILVRSFSMNKAGTAVEPGGRWQISNGYGLLPRWRDDGRELYYLGGDGTVMAVDITASSGFAAGKPHALGARLTQQALWDSSADGKRFLSPGGSIGPQPFTVIVNWQTPLKK